MVEAAPQIYEDSSEHSRGTVAFSTTEYRDKHIADVAYNVDLSLPKGSWYTGKIQVSFKLL
jgi:hypothetical protein